MPVLLIEYSNGNADVHCQTGDHHVKAINKAKKILKKMGYRISDKNIMVAPSGIYYTLDKIKRRKRAVPDKRKRKNQGVSVSRV